MVVFVGNRKRKGAVGSGVKGLGSCFVVAPGTVQDKLQLLWEDNDRFLRRWQTLNNLLQWCVNSARPGRIVSLETQGGVGPAIIRGYGKLALTLTSWMCFEDKLRF